MLQLLRKEKIFFIMASIIKREIKGITYIYEQTATYDAEKRKTVRKQVLIGKVDEATGEIVPTGKKQIRTITTTTIFDANDLKNEIIQKIEPLKESDPEKYKEAVELVEQIPEQKHTTSELGLYQANPLSIMFSGKALYALGQARTVGKIDKIRRNLNINGVTIFLKNFKEISSLGVAEQKIFRYIIAAFTEKNSTGTQNPQLRQRLFLSLSDYAKVTGTDISTEDRLKNFKKKLKKNLDNLKEDTTFSWTETIGGKDKSYTNISFISGHRITKDTIVVELSLSAAEYLVSLNTFIQYPRSLYLIDDRDYNSFAIGETLARHYSMNNNVIRGTEQMISVLKLLECTSFPSYETIKEQRASWEQKIKEPLEKALEHLHQCGTIKDWCYSKAKGIKLTDEEAYQITSYEKFVSLYIWYELNEYPEHSERTDIIIEAKSKKTHKPSHSKRSHKKV